MLFTSKKPQYECLRKKWTARHRSVQNKFWEKHGQALKHLALGSVGGLMLLSTPYNQPLPLSNLMVSRDDILKGYDSNFLLAQALSDKVPAQVRPLEPQEEKDIVDILSRNFGFAIRPEVDNIRLNRNYGLIGGEQHLYRYPGDNL